MLLLLCSRSCTVMGDRRTYPYKLALAHLHKFRVLRTLPSNNRRHRCMLQTRARPNKYPWPHTVYRQNLESSFHVFLSKGQLQQPRRTCPWNNSQLQDNPSDWDNYRYSARRIRKELDRMPEWPGRVRRANFQLQSAALTRRNHDWEFIERNTPATAL